MPSAILYVESQPASAEDSETYHAWYDGVHIPEMLAIDGFVSARRYRALDDSDSYLAVYQIDSDVETARSNLAAAASTMSRPEGVKLDPPPTVRYFDSN
jgi:hypothetical protein